MWYDKSTTMNARRDCFVKNTSEGSSERMQMITENVKGQGCKQSIARLTFVENRQMLEKFLSEAMDENREENGDGKN